MSHFLNKSFPSGIVILLLCPFLLGVMQPSLARAEARSIQEFVSFEEKWPSFVVTGYVWHLEGRLIGINDGTLMFTHCSLPFRISKEQAGNRGVTGVVEVTGRIVEESKGLAFKVDKLVSAPRDLDRIKSMRLAMDSQKPEQWYEIADWAKKRSEFYNDKELAAAALDLNRQGVLAELRQIDSGNEQAFQELLKKGREKQVGADLIQQIQHDALRARWKELKGQPFSEAPLKDFHARLLNDLSGGETVLKAIPKELDQQYQADPSGTFAAANLETREALTRLFAIDVLLTQIQGKAKPDGSNGYDIAPLIRSSVPERKELADDYENRAERWHMQRLGTFSRSQLDEFARRLEKQGKAELAHDARKTWLITREGFYRQEGARGLADLAQLWIELLGDQHEAAQLYIAAWKENPNYTPAVEWLMSHGYTLHKGNWLTAEAMAELPVSPRERAIREGRIEVGMTSREMQAALGTGPTTMTRVASRHLVSEWWVYEEAGICVELKKATLDREAVVVKIEKMGRPSSR